MNSDQKDRKKKPRDPDLVAAEAAMKRAARKAREEARQAGMGVIIMENGKIIEDRSVDWIETDAHHPVHWWGPDETH